MSGVAYGNGVYIAVGYYGSIVKSTDSVTWTNVKTKADSSSYTGVSNPDSFSFRSVAFGNGVFVATGGNGVILTSPDGDTWTQRTSGTTESIGEIKYISFNGSSDFYAASKAMYLKSADGISWTTHTPTGIASDRYVNRIAVNGSGTLLGMGDSAGYIYRTTNGSSWSRVQPSSAVSGGTATSTGTNMLTWMNDRFYISSPSAWIWTSTDLSSFSIMGSPFKNSTSMTGIQMFNGIYDGSKYYMFGSSSPYGYGAIYTSTNGSSWAIEPFKNSFVGQGSVYTNGKYFRVGNEGMLVSSDADNWSHPWGGTLQSAVYDGSQYVAVGANGNDGTAWTSPDLQTWTPHVFDAYSKNLNAIAYGNGKYVAVGENFNGVASIVTSSDGVSWSKNTSISDATSLYSLAYGNGLFVAVGTNGSVRLLTSTDGVTWTQPTLPATSYTNLYFIKYINNQFFAIGGDMAGNNLLWKSTDGTNWTDISSTYTATSDILAGVTYHNGKYYLLGYDGATYEYFVISSSDLSSWSGKHRITNVSITGSWANQFDSDGTNLYVIGADMGTYAYDIYYSTDDGASWSAAGENYDSNYPMGISYANNQMMILGSSLSVKTVVDMSDSTPPVLSGSSVTSVSETGGTLSATSNESGTLYYVVTTSSSAPTAVQVAAGQNESGTAALASGSSAVTAATQKNFTLSGLTGGTAYYCYLVSKDAVGNTSVVASTSFTTSAPNTAPTFTGGANTGLTVSEDSTATTISTSKLEVKDAEQAVSDLIYTVGTAPTKGTLKNTNTSSSIIASSTFTQEDVNNGYITFTPIANANGSDSFTFSVLDGAGGSITGQSFSITITAVNDAPTGVPTVSGTPTEGQTLSASTTGIADVDGLGAFSYKWQKSANGTTGWSDISGATSSNYTLATADSGYYLRVAVSYTDLGSTNEMIYSASTAQVSALPDTTAPIISGVVLNSAGSTTAQFEVTSNESGTVYYVVTASATTPTAVQVKAGQDQAGTSALKSGNNTLVATTGKVIDITGLTAGTSYYCYFIVEDGSGNKSVVSYKAFATVVGNTPPTFTGGTNLGLTLLEDASYAVIGSGLLTVKDAEQTATSLTFTVTTAPTKGKLIRVSDTSGAAITVFTQSEINSGNIAYKPNADANGADSFKFKVSDRDGGNLENQTFGISITAVNDTPSGVPTISGTPKVGVQLTSSVSNISDKDGLGVYSYQWQRSDNGTANWTDISGATSDKYLLTSNETGKYVRMKVSYTDMGGTAETVISTASGPINASDDITAPTLSGVGSGSVTGNGATIKITSNETGKVYYVVTTSSTAPTAAQVVAGQGATGAAALKSGDDANTAATEKAFAVTGLQSGTQYYYYFVAVDGSGNKSAVTGGTFTTTSTGDTTAPTLSGVGSGSVTGNGATIKIISNETGKVYYVVTTSSTAPTAAQVVAGQGATGTAALKSGDDANTAATEKAFAISGLQASTKYYYYFVAVDGSGNKSAVMSGTFTTLENKDNSGGGSSGGSSGGASGGGSSTPSSGTPDGSVEVLINGKTEYIGTAETSTENNQTKTTVSVDPAELNNKLATEGNNAVVTIPVKTNSTISIGLLTGEMVKNMENSAATLKIETNNASYTLPAKQINIDNISKQIGADVSLGNIKVEIEISQSPDETVKLIESTATKGNFEVVIKPIDFVVRCSTGDKVVEVTKFNSFIERAVLLPDGIDPSKITTGVVLEADGTVRHVPTTVVQEGGRYYAKINSLTNSVYSVVWHPIEFKDMEGHWAKDDVNDMGSRMIIEGVGDGLFDPNRQVTRAEFTAMLVKAMGLKLESGETPYSDVSKDSWYHDYVSVAYDYGFIVGNDSKTFEPMETITREEAMVMTAKAMEHTSLADTYTTARVNGVLSKFKDAAEISTEARTAVAACVDKGIVSGKSATTVAAQDKITRAEIAVIVKHLLEIANLI